MMKPFVNPTKCSISIAQSVSISVMSSGPSLSNELVIGAQTEVVLLELSRIERHPLFVTSPGLQRFLRYIVEETIAGREDDLKETYLGVILYGKQPTYDPREQPVVRVAASRLRGRIAEYYALEKPHGIRIDLPRGSYIPEFIPCAAPDVPPTPLSSSSPPLAPELRLDRPYRAPWYAAPARLATILLLTGIAFILFWSRYSTHASTTFLDRDFTDTPLTSELGFALDPAVSPDGKTLAYVWDGGIGDYNIYLHPLSGGPPTRLTHDPSGSGAQDLHPAWAPDGKRLAYLRITTHGGELRTIASTPGSAASDRKLIDIVVEQGFHGNPLHAARVVGPIWSHDGQGLIFADAGGQPGARGLTLLSLTDGHRTILTRPTVNQQDEYPALSPDGAQLAFIRFANASVATLYLLNLQTGALRKLTDDWSGMRGVAWDPSGQELAISGNRFRNTYAIWRIFLDGRPPVAVASSVSYPLQPFFSPDRKSLILTSWHETSDIAHLALRSSGEPPFEPVVLFPSVLRSFSAHYSHDGQRIAFVSNRSGSWEVWVGNRDESNLHQLTHLNAGKIAALAWDPSGARIVAQVVYQEHLRIVVIDSASGDASPLRIDGFENIPVHNPAWSSRGDAIYFTCTHESQTGLWRTAADGLGEPTHIVDMPVQQVIADPSGKDLYFTTDVAGVWRLPLGGGPAQRVPALDGVFPAGNWDLIGQQLYLINSIGKQHPLEKYDLRTGQMTSLSQNLDRVLSDTASLSVDPLSPSVLFARQAVTDGSSIEALVRR